MKAPDVIYLAESDKVKGEVSSNYASENPFRTHTSIAYIRKDALLEWIQEARTIPHENAISRDLAFQEVVNYLNSM